QERWTQLTDKPSRLGRSANLEWPLLQRPAPLTVPVPGIRRDIHVKIASTPWEWEQAFQLVADNYQARGYEAPGTDFRFTSYHALPDTMVLVARESDKVVATLSLVADNTLLGLPLENIYRAELNDLRRSGPAVYEMNNPAHP